MGMQLSVIAISLLIFLAVVALVEGVDMAWRANKEAGRTRIRRRLRDLSAGGGHGQQKLLRLQERQLSDDPWLNQMLVRLPRVAALDRLLQQAGSSSTVAQLLGLQLLIIVSLLLAALLVLQLSVPVALVISLATGIALPILLLMQRRQSRHQRFIKLLPDTMDFIARGIRAGNPFTATLQAASKEMAYPVNDELSITFDEINYGLELEDALRNLQTRVGGSDIAYFVTAVLIQKRTGGNLADVLSQIAMMLRERAQTAGEVRIQAAEMQVSAYVLIGLPIIVTLFLAAFRGEYLAILWEHPMGQWIIAAQLSFMLVGYLVIRRMVRFQI